MKKSKIRQSKFPPGWDEERVRRVVAHYEQQTEEAAVAEDEAAFEDRATMEIPPQKGIMFKKILVPLDGSEIAAKILPNVTELAKTFKAKVTLFHVCYSGVGADIGEAAPGVIRAAEAQEAKWCNTFLAKAAQDLKKKGVEADWVCADGVPAREIIAYAQEKNYDLIALGTHGTGEVAWYMGKVADRVSSHATVPVLLFRTLEMKPPLLKEEYFEVG